MDKYNINLNELFNLTDKKFKTKKGEKTLEEILSKPKLYKNDTIFINDWNNIRKIKSFKLKTADAFSSLDEEEDFEQDFDLLTITKEDIEKMVEKAEEHFKERITSYGYTPPDMDVYHIIAKHLIKIRKYL